MQSKISAFFKSTSSVSAPNSPDPPQNFECDGGDLTLWEKAEHQYINTYKRRAPNVNRNEATSVCASQTAKNPISSDSFSKQELAIWAKPVIKNKKRSYAQYHLELGQSNFLLHTCSTCGAKYTPGDESDEKTHKTLHKNYTHGIQFKGWCNERVVHMPSVEGGKIIVVLESDAAAQRNKVEEAVKMMEIELGTGWIFHKNCKVYLFVSSHRIVGCLVAEPIRKAFEVLSYCQGEKLYEATINELRHSPKKLQFGDITFQREVIKRGHTVDNPKALDMNSNGAILCEREAVPAVCGIRAIWVTPANRRKRIASRLLDAARKSFCTGFVLERSQLAFSQPTLAGTALASNYVGTSCFLVYKNNIMG